MPPHSDAAGVPKAAQGIRLPENLTEGKPRPVRLLRAVEFIRPMRGGSQPALLRCDSGDCYVVKFRNNPQHVRVLANEMFAARLAAMIGLPVAEPALIEVAESLAARGAESNPRTFPHPLPLPRSGLEFGSRFPGDPHTTLIVDFLPDRLLRQLVNLRPAFLGALAFDKWTCNCDGRQFIFHRQSGRKAADYSAMLIDQGFCFNDGEWSFPDAALRGIYPRRLVYETVRGLRSFEPYVSRIENLTREQLKACARGIPKEWCGDEPQKLIQLIEALYSRRLLVRQAIIDARDCGLEPFPNWH
ncbi:MAG: HipA family kinase [Terriglobia bacterium]